MSMQAQPHLVERGKHWLAMFCLACAHWAVLAQPTAKVDADALAKAAVSQSGLQDPGGKVARRLADAVRALPPWAPFYPAATLGMDSGGDGPGQMQLGFVTRDSQDQVARFYLDRFKQRGMPTDLREPGVRTIEVSNSKGDQITSVILQARSGGGVSAIIKHEGGGY